MLPGALEGFWGLEGVLEAVGVFRGFWGFRGFRGGFRGLGALRVLGVLGLLLHVICWYLCEAWQDVRLNPKP